MNVPPKLPVTDELPIALRAYAAPSSNVKRDPDHLKSGRPRRVKLPASGWTLVFDTETTTGPGQALRFGTYQFRRDDELDEAGIFYDPDGVTADEIATLRVHAEAHGLLLRTRDDFVDQVFFAQAFQLRATIVGFNLPFDISMLAIAHGTARAPLDDETNAMRDAFTFKLSRQKIYPNVRVKHMSQKAALISFAAQMRRPDGRGRRRRGLKTGVRRGHFIDVKTLAHALFARGFSLASLSRFLEVPNPKLEFDEFDGPVTDDMVRYAVRDVQATWECYADLIGRFGKLALSRTIPEKVYSEASIGKGYLREMGVVPWREVQPDVPPDLIAKIMGSYFGGRSEVRIRREIRQVVLCDFLSMYPTVCTLMGLWPFVIANGMSWRDATDETRSFIESIDLDTLQSPATWQHLTTLVRVLPDGDIFPVRAAYSGEAQSTIGANYLSSDSPVWFTLADCIASKLLTGKAPHVVEAISFSPKSPQAGLRSIDIAGNPEYHVDPLTTDFFKRVIELRQSIKERMKTATGAERERLDIEQNALKICANSTSYGIWVEVNVENRPFRRMVTVLSSTSEPFSFKTDLAEMPGSYFHPLLATLITGAARLMLAIAERLLTDRGLEWAFCDTDSMAIAKPANIGGGAFDELVGGIVAWFTALNPYVFGGSILKIEDENASLETGEPEPLYCLAISSKRYVLFNLAPDGTPIMRKVSAHGLGHLLPPYSAADAPADLPTPHDAVLGNGIERWHCDLWHHIVTAALGDHPDRVQLDYHPALRDPAMSRYSATTPELLRWFKTYNAGRIYRDQVKPFCFLLSMTSALALGGERLAGPPARGRPKKRAKFKPIAPFGSDRKKVASMAFDRDSGAPVPLSALKSYADALAQYHLSPESKFLNGDYCDRGTTLRRHVRMTTTRHIGKESHDWERQAMIGLSLDSEIDYGLADDGMDIETLRALIASGGARKASTMFGLSVSTLKVMARGEELPSLERVLRTVAPHLPAAEMLSQQRHDRHVELVRLRDAVERDGLRVTARRLRVDPSNLRRRLQRLAKDPTQEVGRRICDGGTL